jgi:hypothetical protein
MTRAHAPRAGKTSSAKKRSTKRRSKAAR